MVVGKLWRTSHRPTVKVLEQPHIGCQSCYLLFQPNHFPFVSSAHQAHTSGGLLDPLTLHRVSCGTATMHSNPLICDACHFLFISFLPWIVSNFHLASMAPEEETSWEPQAQETSPLPLGMHVPAGQPEGVLSSGGYGSRQWNGPPWDEDHSNGVLRVPCFCVWPSESTSSGDTPYTRDNTLGHFKHFHNGICHCEQCFRISKALP